MRHSIIKICFFMGGLFFFSCGSDDGPGNRSPEQAVPINPSDQAGEVEIENLSLQWQQATDPDGDQVSYDVYLDTVTPPTEQITTGLNTTNYTVGGNLDFGAAYYWSIVAKDGNGGSSQSHVYSFTTREAYPEELIVGKWFMNEVFIDEIPVAITDCEKTSYFEFEANGTLTVVQYEGDPCTISSSTILNYNVPDETTLLLTDGSITETAPIVTLTRTALGIILGSVQYNFVKQ